MKHAAIEDRLLDKIQLVSSTHAQAIAAPTDAINIEALYHILQITTLHPEIVCVEVKKTGYSTHYQWPIDCAGLSSSHSIYSTPLYLHDKIVGQLHIFYTTGPIISELNDELLMGALLIFMLVAVTTIVAFLALKTIVGVPVSQLLKSIRAADSGGDRRPVNWSSRDELGRVIDAYNGMIQQVDQKTQQLVGAREHAEANTRIKSRFLANMSHELRTPLNAVIGINEMLREDAVDSYQDTEPYDRVGSAGKHLLGLIDDILDFSKIEANKIELQLKQTKINELLHDVVATIKPLAKSNNNRFEHSIGNIPDTIVVDPVRLRQVLFNLLENACKFTNNGLVTLTAEIDPGSDRNAALFSVSDTGIGISQEQAALLFNEYTQGETTTSVKYGGYGLGLAISQRLCKMMGSEINIVSVKGEGSTFSFSINLE